MAIWTIHPAPPPPAELFVSLFQFLNRVSPTVIQEIIDTGDQTPIDEAWDQMTVENMTRYLESLPSPPTAGGVSPAGVCTPLPVGFKPLR